MLLFIKDKNFIFLNTIFLFAALREKKMSRKGKVLCFTYIILP